ncbi:MULTISPECIES: hypothetical protein [unclassified Micromonospora]|uniref:hypothetical protein n=1 Tax=Micromonospora TaxID=1873 RepID=UPI002417DA0D|nr:MULTISPECIES: hypothetical protein [unclassified Micromonospora]MDG4815903.1 hypothetical protein [Micromonospora sp. WMMD956]WFE58441.1 hypothetical protein O7633_16985 [Micromonospora sp. WMMD712]
MTDSSISFEELEARADLVDVVVYEVSGKRRDGFDLPEGPADLNKNDINILQDGSDERIRIRCQIKVDARDGIYSVDVAAIFDLSEPTKLSDDLRDNFALHIGIPSVYPYLRVELQMAARRLGLKPPILALFKPREHEVELKQSARRSTTAQLES